MTKQIIYRYFGTNGTISSPVHLEDVYYVRYVKLIADDGKILTNGDDEESSILVPEAEVSNWREITKRA